MRRKLQRHHKTMLWVASTAALLAGIIPVQYTALAMAVSAVISCVSIRRWPLWEDRKYWTLTLVLKGSYHEDFTTMLMETRPIRLMFRKREASIIVVRNQCWHIVVKGW